MGVRVAPETSEFATPLSFDSGSGAPFSSGPRCGSEDDEAVVAMTGSGKAESGEETQTTRSRARRKEGRVL